MSRAAALALVLCAAPALGAAVEPAAPAPAAAPATPRPPKPDALSAVQDLFDRAKYDEVIARLPPAELQKLGKSDLKRAYDLLGLSYGYNDQADRAISVFQLASELFPKDLNLLTHLAELLHRQELDDQARPLFERALKVHPNNAVANRGVAEIAFKTGLLEEAQEHFELTLADTPHDVRSWRGYAKVLAARRNYVKAAEAIQKAIDLAPEDASSIQALAQFQHQQGLKKEAYASIDRAIAAADASQAQEEVRPELSLIKASWLLEDGKLDQSLEEAQSVLYRFPQDPLALWLRASIALKRGDAKTALADLEIVAAQPRQAPFAAKVARAMLKELGRTP